MSAPIEALLDQLADVVAEALFPRVIERLAKRLDTQGATPLPPVSETTTRRTAVSPKPRAKALPAKRESSNPMVSKVVETVQAHGSAGVASAELRSALGGTPAQQQHAIQTAKRMGKIRLEGRARGSRWHAA